MTSVSLLKIAVSGTVLCQCEAKCLSALCVHCVQVMKEAIALSLESVSVTVGTVETIAVSKHHTYHF